MQGALAAIVFVVTIVPASAQSFAEAFGGFKEQGNTPIAIDANALDIQNEQGRATFSGAVRVVQNSSVLTTQKLVVSYSGGSLTEPSAISRLSASGNLKVQTGNRIATASTGVFNLITNVVVLSGNVRVTEAGNTATGCKLTVNLNSGNAKLQSRDCGGAKGGSGRVQLQITPKN